MEEKMFDLKIISPTKVFLEDKSDFLELEATDGAMGIYKNHVPTTIILEPCVIKIHKGEEIKRCMISGGFAEILTDKITIMAEDVLSPEDVDINRAKESRDRAKERIAKKDNIDMIRAEISLKRALSRLELVGEA